jgi:polyhydroxyalkanoate synthesis regulator phasin
MAGREDLRSMQDAWRAYLDLALGLTETSRKRATKVARKLVGRGGATADQLQTMAEDLLKTSMANREAMTRLIHFELDRALGRVGLATNDEVAELTSRVRELEQELASARALAAEATGVPTGAAAEAAAAAAAVPLPTVPPVKAVRRVAKKAVATTSAPPAKAVPTKAVAKKVVAKKAAPLGGPVDELAAPVVKTAGRAGARKASAGDAVVKVTPARVVAKKAGAGAAVTPVRKAAAKKAVVKKATPARKIAGTIADDVTRGEV